MSTSSKTSLLYIVNFYGSPPLNYFEKYILKSDLAFLTIVKLPSTRLSKNKIKIDSFIIDEDKKKFEINLNIFFPLPSFFVFFVQYIINFFLLFALLRKIKRKKFDIVIGETNFGSALAFLLKKLGRVNYSVYFNGDILPDPKSSKNCFFIPVNSTSFKGLLKFVDTLILYAQFLLRKIGYNNDLVWYGNKNIKAWDRRWRLISKDGIVYDPILIDTEEFNRYTKRPKDMTALAYIGRIDEYVGLDIVIPALAKIKKYIPKIKLHMIGGSEVAFEKYKKIALENDVLDRINFHGYLAKMNDALDIMSRCALGLALYKPTPDNVSMIAQPAKPKEYIKVGIPVLVTRNGPNIGKEIVKWGAGIESNYNTADVAKTIVKLLKNEPLYDKLKANVKKYATISDYSSVFSQVWQEIASRHSIVK